MPDLTMEHIRTCADNTYWQKKVKGSRGADYTVTFQLIQGEGFWSCTCPSFKYRQGDCKHITAVAKSTVTKSSKG